jgi:acetylornithine deacetylase/succinyl-diaminopimelate desuccinylase-like protein
VDLTRLIDRGVTIQSIPAPTFGEEARAQFLRSELESAGLPQIVGDTAGNLLARVPGGLRPPLIVCAHMDHVYPAGTALGLQRGSQRIIGPGIADNAIGLAALVELAHDLRASPPAGDVWLVATVAEEGLGNLAGMRRVVERFGSRVSAYLALEGMTLGHVYHRALPARRFRVHARTQGGHSWTHSDRTSAIHALIRLAGMLLDLELPSSPRTTLNIGRMAGGTTVNSVAAEASLEIDLRSENEDTLRALADSVAAMVGAYAAPGLQTVLEPIGERPGGELPIDHPLVQAAGRCLAQAGERNWRPEICSSDASLPLSLGLPALCLGLTTGGKAHSLVEYIDTEPLSRGYRAALSFVHVALALPGA